MECASALARLERAELLDRSGAALAFALDDRLADAARKEGFALIDVVGR